MDIGLTFAKCVLFIFNLLFAFLGIVMAVMGIVAMTQAIQYHDLIGDDFIPFPIYLIIAGCALFFVAYLGCCGSLCENTCMLCMYAFIMIIVVAFEIVIISASSKRNEFERAVENRLNYTLHNADRIESYQATWDLLQDKLKCCGINGPNDWDNVLKPNGILPGSCCQMDSETCYKIEAIQTGCKTAFVNYLNSNIVKVAGIAIGAIVLQVLSIVFPCCLFSAIRRDERLPRRWNRF